MKTIEKRRDFEPPRNGADAIDDLIGKYQRDLHAAQKQALEAAEAVHKVSQEIERITTIIAELLPLREEGN